MGAAEFWGAPRRCKVRGGSLRLLSAREVLEARREGKELAQGGAERALCANACLIARAYERRGRPVFDSGRAVLEGLRVEEISALAERWGQFNRDCNPSPLDGEEVLAAAKKAWSTRLTRAFNGVCSVALARCSRRSGRGA